MASIPVGSLVAKNDYYRKRLGSASSVSSCGSTSSNEHLEGPPHPHHPHHTHPHPGLPSHAPGNWWLGFFFNKTPATTTTTTTAPTFPPGTPNLEPPLESSELVGSAQQPPIAPAPLEHHGPPHEEGGVAGGGPPHGLLAGLASLVTPRGSAGPDTLHGAADLELASATAMMAAMSPGGDLAQSDGSHPGP